MKVVFRSIDLHPVHADVAAAGLRVVRDDGRERDERRRVARPAALDRQEAEVDVVAAQHDLLARALADGLRARVGDRLELPQAAHLLAAARSGGCISSTSATFCATSSSCSTPNARHIRRSVPNWLISSGCSEPFGFSNSSAGPPALTVRSTISVISRSGSTSAETRTSSPSRSSSAIQSRRSFTGASLRTERVGDGVLQRERASLRTRLLDVGEEEGDGAARQVAHVASLGESAGASSCRGGASRACARARRGR